MNLLLLVTFGTFFVAFGTRERERPVPRPLVLGAATALLCLGYLSLSAY